MTELEQTVKLFRDSDKTGKQFVTVDYEDNWILITHDGEAVSMSIENWRKLVALAECVINGEKPEQEAT
jgi:hypothetical protein